MARNLPFVFATTAMGGRASPVRPIRSCVSSCQYYLAAPMLPEIEMGVENTRLLQPLCILPQYPWRQTARDCGTLGRLRVTVQVSPSSSSSSTGSIFHRPLVLTRVAQKPPAAGCSTGEKRDGICSNIRAARCPPPVHASHKVQVLWTRQKRYGKLDSETQGMIRTRLQHMGSLNSILQKGTTLSPSQHEKMYGKHG
ncbi:hypothetical protein NM688_g8331 [Phlebia brevispora]|uniref:Uncharacterized protein n=1 Tax=Phlebia brevispora TaxID=194682 RepID=A0ACC1RUQ4_9APHY|nr:hypothetical protein NM688_g8331 [Phlebia brevispora]